MVTRKLLSGYYHMIKRYRFPFQYPCRLHLYQFRQFHETMNNTQDTRPPGHRQRRMNHLKLMNFSMEVDEDKVEVLVHTNGLVYSDFDAKSSLPKPWQLMKLLESARFFSHHWPLDESGRTFRDYSELTSDRLTFLVTSEMDIKANLYDAKIPKCPLDVKVQGGYFGNTSMTSIATVLTKEGEELLSNTNQVVSIDKSTRRPAPLPDWWKNKYAKSAEKFSALKVHKFDKPDNLEPFKIHVVRSDLDGNNHVNWTVYVRYSLDGIYHFAKKGALPSLGDVDKRGLKRMEIMYTGESFDEDVLNVFVWEHGDKSHNICVQIHKEDNPVFQGTFEYFENVVHH